MKIKEESCIRLSLSI